MQHKTTRESLAHFLSRRPVSAANVEQFERLLEQCINSGEGCEPSMWPRLIELGDLQAPPEVHGRIFLKAALAAANPHHRKPKIDLGDWVEGFMIIAEKMLAGIKGHADPGRVPRFLEWCGCQEEDLARQALTAVVKTAEENAFDLDRNESAAIEWLKSGRRALSALYSLDDLMSTRGEQGLGELKMPKDPK